MHFLKKLLLLMHFTALLILGACLTATAAGYSQRVSLDEKDADMVSIFKQITRQTGYTFAYADKLVAGKKLTIEVVDETLENTLAKLFADLPLTFTIVDKTVVVKSAGHRKDAPRLELTNPPVTGIVRGPDGQPLAGVNIVVKGTKRGTTSDANGKFSIEANENDVLLLTSIGYAAKELKVSDDNNMIIDLQRSTSPLDEVQIIAYGTTTKRFNTGNIASVKAADIEKQPVNNPLLALQGRVPGLFITQNTGVPGGGVTVRIQGQNSINNGNDPLYVIDGVPYISQMLATTLGGYILQRSGGVAGVSGSGNPLNYININDIDRIEVLKDADATAIYGSRAANGAILITTKKGKAGPLQLDINVQHGWGRVTRMMDLMNTEQYLQMRREALKNDGITEPSAADYDINGVWDTTRYTDWQKTLLGGTAQFSNINATLSGGTSLVQYMLGATYNRQTIVFPGDFADQKGGMHFSLNTNSVNGKFKLSFLANYLADNNQLPLGDLNGSGFSLLAPNAPALYNADGSLNWELTENGTSTWNNPLSFVLRTYTNKTNNLISNINVSYEIIEGLQLRTSMGYNRLQTDELLTTPLTSYRPDRRPTSPRSATYTNSTSRSWIIEPQINYQHNFGNSRLDVLLGSTLQHRKDEGENIDGFGYISDAVLEDIRAAADITVNSTVASMYKYNAAFARINYIVRDKYIINLTGRRDGSSRFGPANRFHNFGAAGAAWIFSEEKWIKNNLSLLSFGKLQGSYGTTGNDQIVDYRYMDLYEPAFYGVGYQGGTGIIANRLTNIYLQWEETRKLQAGFQLGFLQDKMSVNVTYVRNRSSNQLLDYTLPLITGFTGVFINFPATIQNTQWEFAASTKNITRKLQWTSHVNLTIPTNKLIAFPTLETSTYANQLIIGQPVDVVKIFPYAGVNSETGVYQFLDSEGKQTSAPDPLTDATVLQSSFPTFYGGLENSFSYKGISLQVLFQFVKQKAYGARFGLGSFPPGRRNANQPVSVTGRWTKPGEAAAVQQYDSDGDLYQPYTDAYFSAANFEDASFIRMKNISLSYQLPDKWKNNVRLKHCSIYLQAQNLWTITGYSGADPESRGSAPLKVLTVGLKAGL